MAEKAHPKRKTQTKNEVILAVSYKTIDYRSKPEITTIFFLPETRQKNKKLKYYI